MNKKQLFLATFLFLSLCFVFLVSKNAYGQANRNEIKTQLSKICLQGEGASDLQKTVTIAAPAANVDVHLTGSGFGNANVVYVALCLPSKEKTVCTTGDPQLDKEIFGADFTADIKNLNADAGAWSTYAYGEKNTGNLSLKIAKNKIKPTGGKISAVANMSNALGHFVYPFYGFYQEGPTAMLETGGAGEGQKQGTFTFAGNVDTKNCTTILWDPYGRIFDSQSLEPIPGITIKVLTSILPLEKLAQIFGNPQTTFEDGAFNFLVEPGTYYLRLVNLPSKYTFKTKPNLSPNYSKAYSKRDGTSSIYQPDDRIVEVAKKPEHRDIPLDPGKNPLGHFPVVNITTYGYDQMTFGDSTKYGGKISHPFSIVALIGKKTKKEVSRITADKFGFWSISIVNKLIPQDEPLVIKLIKVDLTTMKSDEKNGRITNDVTFYPIAQKIQGYLYNEDKIANNTPVTVTLENNNKAFYQTITDKNGYLSIPSNNLPNFSYNLIAKFAGTNITKRLSTDVFAQENKAYLEKNNINLMVNDTTKNKKTGKQPDSNLFSNTTSDLSNPPAQVNQARSTTSTQKGNTFITVILLLAVIFVILTAGFVLYFKKLKNANY